VPPTVIHPEPTEVTFAAAAALVGHSKVDPSHALVMGAKDFLLMLEALPGAYMFFGGGTFPEGTSAGLHTPHFDFNDKTTALGVTYWVSVVDQELGHQRG